MKLTKRQYNVLKWIKETPHHYGGWYNEHRPIEEQYFMLGGRKGTKRMGVKTMEVMASLFSATVVPPELKHSHMFYPTAKGRKLMKEFEDAN